MLILGGSKWKSDRPSALVCFTYSMPLFHIPPRTAGLFFLQGSGGHALSFLQKIVSQDFNLWLLDVTKHNIRNTYVSYLPFFLGINKRSV